MAVFFFNGISSKKVYSGWIGIVAANFWKSDIAVCGYANMVKESSAEPYLFLFKFQILTD